MKRKLNIAFVGSSPAVPIEERFVYRLIARHYDICPSGKPDYVVVQGAAYLQHCRYDDSIKILLNGENFVPDPHVYEQGLEAFLCHIFDQPLEKARRRNRYGCQAMMQAHLKKVLTVDQWLCDLRRKLRI